MLPTLSPQDALARAQTGELLLIDIRRSDEWAATGLPENGHGITMGAPDFIEELQKLGANKYSPIGLICASGRRSAATQEQLIAAGFTSVYNIIEGMTGGANGPGWIARALPTQGI